MIDLTNDQRAVFEAAQDFILDPDQGNIFTVHGLAGTGKTVLAAALAQEHDLPMMAPTGKAASNLRRKTDRVATTIHRVVYNLIDEEHRKRWGRAVTVPFFERRDKIDLPVGSVVILDECSMVTDTTRDDILKCGLRVVAFGDPGQLKPVNGKPGFSAADSLLNTIHRQAEHSGIIRSAHAVRHGNPIEWNADVTRVRDADLTPTKLLAFDTVLCWTNRNRHLLNAMMRGAAGRTSLLPMAGEPIMALRNKYDLNIYNGGVYTVQADIRAGDTEIAVDVDGTSITMPFAAGSWGNYTAGVKNSESLPLSDRPISFDWGYCLTVHKAQGSEWRNVLLLEDMPRGNDDYATWAYTGITRAADKLTVIRG